MNIFKRIFPGYRSARKVWKSIQSPPKPGPLPNMTAEQIAAANRASVAYYEDPSPVVQEYWHQRPFSHLLSAPRYLQRFGHLLMALHPVANSRILDFGCGTGWTSIMLAQMGFDVTGVDIAPAAINIAKEDAERILNQEQRKRCNFQSYSGFRLDFGDGYFDLILAFEAIHHLPNPSDLFVEFARVLGPHGRLGFAEPGVEHSHAEISMQEKEKGILEQDLDLEQLFQTGISAGFRDLELILPPVEPDAHTLQMKTARWFLRGASWLVPANFIRYSIVKEPMGIFRKDSYKFTSLNPHSLQATIQTAEKEKRIAAGKLFVVAVTVQNETDSVWLKEGHHGIGYVRLGATLLDENGNMMIKDYGRSTLPYDLEKGKQVSLNLELKAPDTPGNYIVLLDMVNEGVCWFADMGSQPKTMKVCVSGIK